jgi:hypothetical protein
VAPQSNLIHPNQHDPFEGRACDVCHPPEAGGDQ